MDDTTWSVSDYYSMNPLDAGMSVVLPGPAGQSQTYYVRVQAAVRTIQAVSGQMLTDGETFTLSDGIPSLAGSVNYHTITFQFDSYGDDSYNAASNTAFVPYTASSTAAQIGPGDRQRDRQGRRPRRTAARAAVADNTVVLSASSPASSAGVPGTLIGFDPGTSPLTRINPTGVYQLQVRLQECDEFPGSTVTHAIVSYATNGIEVLGLPSSSPLTGNAAESTTANDSAATAQQAGNLLATSQATLTVAGASPDSATTSISTSSDSPRRTWARTPTTAMAPARRQSRVRERMAGQHRRGLHRRLGPATSIYVYNTQGNLAYIGGSVAGGQVSSVSGHGGSNVADDQLAAGTGSGGDQLSSGSFGDADPSIGTVYLGEGTGSYYDIAVTNAGVIPNPLLPTLINDPKPAQPGLPAALTASRSTRSSVSRRTTLGPRTARTSPRTPSTCCSAPRTRRRRRRRRALR